MPNYVEMIGGPDEGRNTGQILSDAADRFASKAQAVYDAIAGYEARAPWGADEAGTEFRDNVYHATDDSGSRIDLYLKDRLAQAGKELSALGDGVIWAMNDYQATEADNVTDLSRVTKP
jgi:hypothetical protein